MSLVDNVPGICPGEHGLSLYIELSSGFKVLFDTGQGSLFLENACSLGIDISEVDALVLSHGHYDHIGGLKYFLEANDKAMVFMRSGALEPHFSLRDEGLMNIGCADDVSTYGDRIVFCDGVCDVAPGLTLFANTCCDFPRPRGNDTLFASDGITADVFDHEQSLLVSEGGRNFLFAGCAHCGAVNILATAQSLSSSGVDCFISGMHLMRGCTQEYITRLASSLLEQGDCRYVTMHCTGFDNYLSLKRILGDRISYLPCGNSIEI